MNTNILAVVNWSIWETIKKFLMEKTENHGVALAINGFSDNPDKLGITFIPDELVGTESPHLKGRYVTLEPIDAASNSFEITFAEDMGDEEGDCLEGMYEAREVLKASQEILDFLMTGKLPNEGSQNLLH